MDNVAGQVLARRPILGANRANLLTKTHPTPAFLTAGVLGTSNSPRLREGHLSIGLFSI